MPNPALDWLDDLPELRVPGVPGVPSQKTAVPAGTPAETAGAPGVAQADRNTLEHARNTLSVAPKLLIYNKEYAEHPGTPKTGKGDVEPGVPAKILEGIARLKRQAPPRVTRPEAWLEIVTDAARLVADGWAGRALSLGWHPMELFGALPAVGGDSALDGLAVWLGSRRLLLIDDKSALVADGIRRFSFRRFQPDGAALLWELADIQRARSGRR